jgi:hypothetical protein
MESWPHADKHVPASDYDLLAADISKVTLEDREPPVWEDTNRGRTNVLLATLSYNEGARYAEYVNDGSCNAWMKEAWKHPKKVLSKHRSMITGQRMEEWKADTSYLPKEAQALLAFGDCDGGRAASLFQIHADDFAGGIVILAPEAGEWANTADYHGDPANIWYTVHNEDLIRDRTLAVRLALHMARKSIQNHNRLCGYTGEGRTCPKGEIRLLMAESYSRKHPYAPTITE